MERQGKLRPGDVEVIDLDDHILFGCTRSGDCCSGRHILANILSPRETSEIWRVMHASGELATIDDLMPGLLGRGVSDAATAKTPLGVGVPTEPRTSGQVVGTFQGLFFRMRPDPTAADGDRCVFLQGDTIGGYACRWHGTAAQPLQCAIAPVGISTDPRNGEFQFAVFKSRQEWCEGMRRAVAGDLPGFTLRSLLERIDGERRLADHREFSAALSATQSWTRGFRNHHSPLAKLYIAALPELEPALVGY
jgi:hypothetical protein